MSSRIVPTADALRLLRRATFVAHRPSDHYHLFYTTTTRCQQRQQQPPPTSSSAGQTTKTTPSISSAGLKGPVRTKPARPHIRAYDGELQPQPLSRPLGLKHPPLPGQNTGIDDRTLRERRDDFVSYDKHIARREQLFTELYHKNYFRDIGNLGKIHKGKSIIAPATPFREAIALWFPNLRGRTLLANEQDTTAVLRGKVSVVSVVNTEWAKDQCQSFVSTEANPELAAYFQSEAAQHFGQTVEINVEENWIKAALIRMFMGRIRKQLPKDQHGKYFLITKGMRDEIRDALGIWNGKVGYVYLVDQNCKVRWAGNGPAREEERKSLVSCLKRLVDEAKGIRKPPVSKAKMVERSIRPAVTLVSVSA